MGLIQTEKQLDPILFEVIRSSLLEATEEMAVSLQRTAFSTNVKTRLDYSCAFVDAEGRMVVQAFCQPAHLVTIGRVVPRAIAEFGRENLEPGDALLVNDPHRQASHLNDIFLISPFFYEGELLGYLANICHHVDVGGGAPASIGAFREIYQEGIILPVVRLVHAGKLNTDLWKMILANVRAAREVGGDLRAQIAANNIGMRRLTGLLERYGAATLRAHIDRLLEYTETRLLAELEKLPHGTYEAEGWLDDDGITAEPIRLKARVTLGPKKVVFDFAGSDLQRPAPMNSNLTQTFTACVYVLKCLVDPDIPVNEGFYQPIEVHAPEGTVVNAVHPGAIVGGWEVCMRVCEVLLLALSQALPERVPAGTKGMVCQTGFGGRDPRTGLSYSFYETIAGGYGGRHETDGPDAVQTHFQNTQNAPVEEIEQNYPVRIPRYCLIPDSEGPGRRRGGLGVCREYTFVGHEPVFTVLSDRTRFAPWGLFGGGDGSLARYELISGGAVRALPSKSSSVVQVGDVVRVETCGGGGYGPAWEREPALVLADVKERRISAARARAEYGVAIDEQRGDVDRAATDRLRHAMGEAEAAT